MRITIMIGGLFGILISLTAMLFAVVDDSYTLGNFGLLGVLGGIMGIVGSFNLKKRKNLAGALVLIGSILGLYGLWRFYLIPTILMLIPYLIVLLQKNKKQTN
ncbi:hypothetical protein [Oceanobacillus massiliensis]|uniref:hypothetical protein n=1 Tax=Oceanobacillus massiliensis TaxID=1465765 RepID=UPI00028851D8|nr:hypothetical protein [Oceanobacillus massiliensis]